MGNYQSAGVYSSIQGGGTPVTQGVDTAILGTVGWTQKGPVNKPILISSWADFVRKFGDLWKSSLMPYEVLAFFNSGGAKAYVVRVVPDDADTAGGEIESASVAAKFYGRELPDPVVTLDGTHYNIKVQVDAFTSTEIDVTGDNGATGSYSLADIASNINTALAGVDASLANVCQVVSWSTGKKRLVFTSPTLGSSSLIQFDAPSGDDASGLLLGITPSYSELGHDQVVMWGVFAANPGAWGNGYAVKIVGDDDHRNASGGYDKFFVMVYDAGGNFVEKIGPVDLTDSSAADYIVPVVADASETIVVAAGVAPGVPWDLQPVSVSAERLADGDASTTLFSGKLVWDNVQAGSVSITDGTETFTDNKDGTLTGSAGGAGTIDYQTGDYSVTFNAAPGSGNSISASYTAIDRNDSADASLAGGSDGTGPLGRTELTAPTLKATNSGVYALLSTEELLLISVADVAGDATAYSDLLAEADTNRKWFVLVDPPEGYDAQQQADWVRVVGAFNSKYGADYGGWSKIADPLTNGRTYTIPSSGLIAGRYAYTDATANVSSAPAGVTKGALPFAVGLEWNPNQAERDLMYQARVNPLIETTYTGRCIWGARTLSIDTDWRYIQVVRLFQFVEESLHRAMHWAVFENNGPGLWSKMRGQARAFLMRLYRDNYFAGKTADEAFAVVCDSSNNTQADIDAGIVTMDIYLAPNKPGEFIVLRIRQMTKSAK